MMSRDKHTIDSLAAQALVNEKTIRRALNSERVDGVTLEKLANALNCAQQDLLGEVSDAWALSRGSDFSDLSSFALKLDFFDIFKEIRDELNPLNRQLDSDELEVKVVDSEKEITISVTSRLLVYSATWAFRPVRFSSEGVLYVDISDWDKFLWIEHRLDLLRNISDDLTINGVEQVCKIVKPGWRAEFFDGVGLNHSSLIGEQHFPDDASFRNAINAHNEQAKAVRAERGLHAHSQKA